MGRAHGMRGLTRSPKMARPLLGRRAPRFASSFELQTDTVARSAGAGVCPGPENPLSTWREDDSRAESLGECGARSGVRVGAGKRNGVEPARARLGAGVARRARQRLLRFRAGASGWHRLGLGLAVLVLPGSCP